MLDNEAVIRGIGAVSNKSAQQLIKGGAEALETLEDRDGEKIEVTV
jgi:hypothetical protein